MAFSDYVYLTHVKNTRGALHLESAAASSRFFPTRLLFQTTQGETHIRDYWLAKAATSLMLARPGREGIDLSPYSILTHARGSCDRGIEVARSIPRTHPSSPSDNEAAALVGIVATTEAAYVLRNHELAGLVDLREEGKVYDSFEAVQRANSKRYDAICETLRKEPF